MAQSIPQLEHITKVTTWSIL